MIRTTANTCKIVDGLVSLKMALALLLTAYFIFVSDLERVDLSGDILALYLTFDRLGGKAAFFSTERYVAKFPCSVFHI